MLITDRREVNWTVASIAIAATVLTLGYTLPWMIAQLRGKSNTLAVASINVLTGWTLVGWVIALVMSMTPHRAVAAAPAGYPTRPIPPPGWYALPTGTRYWDGTIWR